MLSLTQSVWARGSAGDPLPTVYQALADKGIIFRRGQLCLVCAGPGTGKSAFTLSLALKGAVPTLYMSADSDSFDQAKRAVSIVSNGRINQEDAEAMVLAGEIPPEIQAEFDRRPVRFNYSAQPTIDELERSLTAYLELYGVYPDLIVVDNITNVVSEMDEENQYAGLEGLMDYLHNVARKTQACVVPLHHVTGKHNNGGEPIPRDGVKGQITRVPEMVLTLFKRDGQGFGPDTLGVSGVKIRGAKYDPMGTDFAELEFNGFYMNISDPAGLRAVA